MTAVAEKYARAIGSSHLEWDIDPGAIDMLAAAGAASFGVDDLGIGLLRLRAEYDRISSMPGARNMRENLLSAKGVRARMLGMFNARAAGKFTAEEVSGIVDQILDIWVDPNCPTCSGRGVVGGYGAPQLICTDCGGSKKRTPFIADQARTFVAERMREIEMILDAAQREIRRQSRVD